MSQSLDSYRVGAAFSSFRREPRLGCQCQGTLAVPHERHRHSIDNEN